MKTNIWLQIGITIYSLGIMPFLVGMMWTRRDSLLGVAKTYVLGYISLWALFYVIAVPLIALHFSLSKLVACWRAVLIVVPFLWVIQAIFRWKTVLEQFRQYYSNIYVIKQHLGYVVILATLCMLISIGFIMPSPKDDVPETVAISIDTNRMYRQEPYTKLSYREPEKKIYSPIDMFYAVNVELSGMEVALLIHTISPVFLLAFFCASAWEVGGIILRNKLEEKGLFVVFSLILYTVSIGADRALSFSLFQNVWNGATMLCCCILPLTVAWGFHFLEGIEQKVKVDSRELVLGTLTIVVAQLMLARGAILAILSLICCVGVFVLRKGWEKFGSIRKH